MNVAIIPARGKSKRIPHKNIKKFSGKPIIAYSIETAWKTGLFDRIVVSTDDDKIAEIARQYGAEAPFKRPFELADDYADTFSVIGHALAWLMDRKEQVKHACCIYATAPFLRGRYLRQGLQTLIREECSLVYAVAAFDYPVQRAVCIEKNGRVKPAFPEYFRKRSQDLEKAYHDAGQFYWGIPDVFMTKDPASLENVRPVVLPRYLVQDIDTLEDWKMAEIKYSIVKEMGLL